MTSHHSTSVFKNSCLKLPVNPNNNLPLPSFEQKNFDFYNTASSLTSNQLLNRNNNGKKNSDDNSDIHLKIAENNSPAIKKEHFKINNMSLKFISEFLESIPDYGDINHLSNKEFYEKLNNLKLKQKKLCYEIEHGFTDPEQKWLSTYNTAGISQLTDVIKKSNNKQTNEQFWNKSDRIRNNIKDLESNSEYDISTPSYNSERYDRKKTPSPVKRTVRIDDSRRNTPESVSTIDYYEGKPLKVDNKVKETLLLKRKKKSLRNSSAKSKNSSLDSYLDEYNEAPNKFDILSDSDLETSLPTYSRSAPSSPLKTKHTVAWKESNITIPKPFQMTVRDEEEKIVNELFNSLEQEKEKKINNDSENKIFKANPIPIESRILLYDKMTADHERRREIQKLNRKIALQSQIKPFSFTKKEEELKEISKLLSKSSPQLETTCTRDHSNIKTKVFKAKPVPKNLFSNYFYEKMKEDEYYRELKKRIRSEEMLKASSLPPSMAARQKEYRKILDKLKDNNFLDELDANDLNDYISHEKYHEIPNYSYYHYLLEQELNNKKNNSVTTGTKSFNLNTAKRADKRNKERAITCSRPHVDQSNRASSALELSSVNTSNLAAILRIEAARKRLELEMQHKLEEQRRRDETRWRARLIHKKEAWRSLKYDHEEELALRLQMRKDEERMRQEEFRHQMELMLGRVQQMPFLFERDCEGMRSPRSHKCSKMYKEQDTYDDIYKEVNKDERKESDDETKAEDTNLCEMNFDPPKIVIDDNSVN